MISIDTKITFNINSLLIKNVCCEGLAKFEIVDGFKLIMKSLIVFRISLNVFVFVSFKVKGLIFNYHSTHTWIKSYGFYFFLRFRSRASHGQIVRLSSEHDADQLNLYLSNGHLCLRLDIAAQPQQPNVLKARKNRSNKPDGEILIVNSEIERINIISEENKEHLKNNVIETQNNNFNYPTHSDEFVNDPATGSNIYSKHRRKSHQLSNISEKILVNTNNYGRFKNPFTEINNIQHNNKDNHTSMSTHIRKMKINKSLHRNYKKSFSRLTDCKEGKLIKCNTRYIRSNKEAERNFSSDNAFNTFNPSVERSTLNNKKVTVENFKNKNIIQEICLSNIVLSDGRWHTINARR